MPLKASQTKRRKIKKKKIKKMKIKRTKLIIQTNKYSLQIHTSLSNPRILTEGRSDRLLPRKPSFQTIAIMRKDLLSGLTLRCWSTKTDKAVLSTFQSQNPKLHLPNQSLSMSEILRRNPVLVLQAL